MYVITVFSSGIVFDMSLVFSITGTPPITDIYTFQKISAWSLSPDTERTQNSTTFL